MCVATHTAAGGHGDLDGVSARLAHLLQVQRLVGRLVVPPLDGERSRVDAHLRKRRGRRRKKKEQEEEEEEEKGEYKDV